MNYKDFIKACENTFKITQPLYTKSYENFYIVCRNYLTSRGYAIENEIVKIPQDDQAFTALLNIGALTLTEMLIDERVEKPSLEQSNYFGVDRDGVVSTISTMSFITLQSSCKNNLDVLKSRFPMRELDAVKLCLFMLLFYDLQLYKLSAVTASILYSGGNYDINNK